MTLTDATAATTNRSLVGDVVVVTGASRGIGAATARALVASGATVIGIDRDPIRHEDVKGIVVDLTDAAATSGVVASIVNEHGRIDGLVNNAGLARHGAVSDIDLREFDLMWAVNVRAVVQLTRDAMAAMAQPKGRGGRIVNIVSTAGLVGQPGESAYCATKFAVRGFTEAAAEEGRLVGVHVSGIYPAGVHTPFWDGAVRDPVDFTGDKRWLECSTVATQIVSLLTLPRDVEVPMLVVRHSGDVDRTAIAAKLDKVRRA